MIRPTIETCGVEHLAELGLLAREFSEESHWGLTYDHDVVFKQMLQFISGNQSDVFIVRVDGILAGAAIVISTQDLCKELMGFIHKFYIRKQFRKTLAARSLTKACVEWFDEKKCYISFVTDTGYVHENPLICVFQNLMGKCGFKPLGKTLFRMGKQ